MKTKIALLLITASIGLMGQTKIKISQLQNPATSSLNLGSQTFSVGDIKSNGTFSVNQTPANSWSFQGLVTYTVIPAFYMGVTPAVNNYAILADGTNNVFNGPEQLFLRTANRDFLQANTTATTSIEFISLNSISAPTVAANNSFAHLRLVGNKIGWNAGTTTSQVKTLISADTYSSNGAATITHASAFDVYAPTASTGMTFSNPAWALRASGNANVTNSLIIGAAITTPPTKELDVRGNAVVSGTLGVGSASLTGGNTGTISVLTDITIPFQFGWAVQNPADGQSYYLNSAGVFNINVGGTGARNVLPYNCTLIGYSINNINLGSNGSAESATLTVRKNNTTNTDLKTDLTFASTQLVSDFAQSIDFDASDDFSVFIKCPTWVTNPVQTVLSLNLYFVRRK